MKYKCIGYKNGKTIETILEADSQKDAYIQMENMNFAKISIIELNNKKKGNKKITNKELAVFFRQLSAFEKAGESITKSLFIISEQVENESLKEALKQIRINIEQGVPISTAFAKQKVFPVNCVNLIKVGDVSGNLEKTYSELANYLGQMNDIDRGVSEALLYPKIVLLVLTLAMSYILSQVLPEFRVFYTDMGIEMPLATKIIFAFSDFLNDYWLISLIGFITIVIYLKNFKKYSPNLHDKLMIKLPVIKHIMINLYMFRFVKTLHILLNGGVDIVLAIKLTAETIDNHLYANILNKAVYYVENGESLSSAIKRLDKNKIFHFIAMGFIQTGENTGDLELLLLKASEFYKEDLESNIKGLGKQIEPFLLVPIGIFIGVLTMSIYLPVFKMIQITKK